MSLAPTLRTGAGRLVAVAVTGAVLLLAPIAYAQDSTGTGTATVVDAQSREPISGGDGETAFSIRLPAGAACPGDSLDGNYRVQSFVAPIDSDPSTFVWKGLKPQVDGAWALYQVNTSTYMNAGTDKAPEPGGEGPIINIPSFSFAVFPKGTLTPGRYHIGLGCSLFAETERHWSTEIEIDSDESDVAGIAWRVVDPPAGTGDDGLPIGAIAGGALVALGGIATAAVVRNGRRRDDPAEVRNP